MLAKNMNVEKGLVNGARGVVVGFESGPTGKQDNDLQRLLLNTISMSQITDFLLLLA